MADFVDEMFKAPEAPVDPAPEAPTPIEQPAEAQVPAAPEPAPAPAPEPAPAADRTVPLATALEWRDEAKELKRWKADQEARQRQSEAEPDPSVDPRGFADWQTQQVEQRLTAERFGMSDMFARQTHGEETVNTAVEWAQQRAQSDPSFAVAYMRERNPIDWIVRQHKRDALVSQIGDVSSVDDWFTQEAAKRGYAPAPAPNAGTVIAQPAAQPAPKPAQPPRSLAADTGHGSTASTDDPRAEFLAIFDKRAV